ncbi:ribonuclease H, partial [Trifolium medium]|nr:ribonuclease H [Trifolium medium]
MNNFPADNVSQIIALSAPTDVDGPDIIGWGGTNTHQFTVQSAHSLQHQNCPTVVGDWKILWKWRGPHRIQTFIWLVAHGHILTNFRRSRWGGGISPTCPCCENGDETVLHVLRDWIGFSITSTGKGL